MEQHEMDDIFEKMILSFSKEDGLTTLQIFEKLEELGIIKRESGLEYRMSIFKLILETTKANKGEK